MTLDWWLRPRAATELPRHTTSYWYERGIGLTDFDRAIRTLAAAFRSLGQQITEALTPVVQSANQMFADLAAAFRPLAAWLDDVGMTLDDAVIAEQITEHIESQP